MKRSILLSTLALFTLVGCGETTENQKTDKGGDTQKPVETVDNSSNPVKKAIAEAEGLHFEALIEKAKTEVGTNEVKVFGNSSSIQKACDNFTKQYGIKFTYSKKGDSDLYKDLSANIPNGQYISDFVFAQDGNMMKSTMLDTGYLLNYLPLDYKDVLAKDDLTPATGGIAFNKVFMYNNTDYDGNNAATASAGKVKNYMTNIWQVAGKKSDPGHISDVSFKDPTQENINMNMLIMLTSPKWVEKLTTAYKAYYGKEYVANPDYDNIGYQFIHEFLDNIVYHKSDGTECKAIASGTSKKMAYVNFNKLKDCKAEGVGAEDKANITTAIIENEINGFGGFIYKMYPLIPNNAKYPLAACAFENYILSTEGYSKAWSTAKGYYTVNPEATVPEGDKALSWWKERCVIEDPEYIVDNYDTVSEFIQLEIAA